MKKTIYTIAGIILLSLFTFTQSITIVKPNNRSTWAKNEANTIEWRKSGEMGDRVKIRLFNHNGSVRIKGITDDTANNGSFRCPPNIFNDVPDGTYTIRVRTLNNRVTGDSTSFTILAIPDNNSDSPRFKILRKRVQGTKANRVNTSPASMVIVSPRRGQLFNLNSGDTSRPLPIRISWRKTGAGTWDKYVKIFLMRVAINNDYFPITLIGKTPNDGFYVGAIPRDLSNNGLAGPISNHILIKTLDGKIFAESDSFSIINE